MNCALALIAHITFFAPGFNEEQFLEHGDNNKYKGIYVYGTLLGKGEKPISLGPANYFDGIAKGGMLLLTNKSLSFSSHNFLQSKSDVIIKLKDIENTETLEDIKENSLEPKKFKRVALGAEKGI